MEITRFPLISENDTASALREIKSYIIRLDRELSLMLDNIGTENLSPALKEIIITRPEENLTNLKNEIIETAHQIKETGDKIELKLINEYVAKSEIGEYTENAFQQINIDGKGITQYFEEISGINGRLTAAESAISENTEISQSVQSGISKINAYIRTGKLADGVYGIEIGNFSGSESAPYKVRLSENRLSFYIGGDEVAYFSDNSMYISRASIPNTLSVGGCVLKNDGGLSFTCE